MPSRVRPRELLRAIDHAFAELARVGEDPGKLPPPLRVVVIIDTAQGIIDNGGLQFFFESDFPGCPPYSIFTDAYRTIGAEVEAQALTDAVALFPFANPHKHQRRRDKFLDRFMKDGCHRPDSPFKPLTDKLCGNEQVWRLLLKYVRAHPKTFRGNQKSSPKRKNKDAGGNK